MTSLDSLTRKLEETHDEIIEVQREVIDAIRSFYGSSSSISADEAVKIAAQWDSSHTFPIDDDDSTASDLQEKMRRLNVALLDAVDHLQLNEAGEMAPEAQLLLSLTQQERLKTKIQQSKSMLTILEQLMEFDRLLGDEDDAIDHQSFLTRAEGVVEAERLLHELIQVDQIDTTLEKPSTIIRFLKLRFVSKKNCLLSDLKRYFNTTVVWRNQALKVTTSSVQNSNEHIELSDLERRKAFWKACELLKILTPRMKSIAKAILEHLIKPMLQLSRGTPKQVRHETSVTLSIVEMEEDVVGSEKGSEVQCKCVAVVNVLEFVHVELFGGDTELMKQLGEVLWTIPGNLETHVLNLLHDHMPQDPAAFDTYRNILRTSITDLENALLAISFTVCRQNNPLRNFIDELDQVHSRKRRQAILSTGRDLMMQGYQDSIKIQGALEKGSLRASSGADKKGELAHKQSSGSSTFRASFNSDDVESSCFQVPDYRVSVCAHEVVEVVHQTLVEACTSSASSAKLLFQTARDLFLLFCSIVPTLYEDDVGNDARTCMLFHNDCLYIAHHMVIIGHLYKPRYELEVLHKTNFNKDTLACIDRLPTALEHTATMVDMIFTFRELGERVLTSFTTTQAEEMLTGMSTLPPLGAIDFEYDADRVESFLKSTLYKLDRISSTWQEGLPSAVYSKVTARMLEPLVKKLVDGVLIQTNISETARARLHHLLSLLKESESLFESPSRAAKYVPSLERLSKLTSILTDPITTVRDKIHSSCLNEFSLQEVAMLVRSLFRESVEKKELLQELGVVKTDIS
ncbi:hypothetical protein CCR75_004187 [Bremia lactucae]|uniref:Centromere/kinetochore protein zw10 n=1 Tax=Bremia lactucae TaxID=4779 RepID=A0A976FKB8_BRELC|nr:hypothetical protein CCR75_004187 [Bremia lactucae]